MSEEPKIVDNRGSRPRKKPKLRIRIRKRLIKYFVMKLNEQLVLGLVHSGYEPIAGKNNVFFRKTGEQNWRMKLNTIRISILNTILLILGN